MKSGNSDIGVRIKNSGDQGCASRLLIVDPNIQGLKGHFLELAMVVSGAASRSGYEPYLATSVQFSADKSQIESVQTFPVFSCDKIRKWSIGPHGYSRLKRNLSAEPIGGDLPTKLIQRIIDRLHGKSPQNVLQETKCELVSLLKKFKPVPNDHILFSTADDFVLLIAGAAFSELPLLRECAISFLWHSPVTTGRACESIASGKRDQQTKEQLNDCLSALKNHRISFFATTDELRFQYESKVLAQRWIAVDYPIRSLFRPVSNEMGANPDTPCNAAGEVDSIADRRALSSRPLRVICGGGQRSEKGSSLLGSLVGSLWDNFLVTGRIQLGLQLDPEAAKKLIARLPKSPSQSQAGSNPLDISSASLDAESYLSWIRSADIGLFLYDSRRYYTRCSGVLIEMLACGKPVIVPAGCWLSRQISTENNNYLMRIESQSSGRVDARPLSVPLALDQTEAYDLTVNGDFSTQVLTFKVENANDHSYIAIESTTQTLSGVSLTRCHILELIDGECRLLLQSNRKSQEEIGTKRLRVWSPYGERRLKLASVTVKEVLVSGATIAPSSIGITFARIVDLPACIDELVTHYQSYETAVAAFQPQWVKRHSGEQFVSKLFQSTSPQARTDN